MNCWNCNIYKALKKYTNICHIRCNSFIRQINCSLDVSPTRKVFQILKQFIGNISHTLYRKFKFFITDIVSYRVAVHLQKPAEEFD